MTSHFILLIKAWTRRKKFFILPKIYYSHLLTFELPNKDTYSEPRRYCQGIGDQDERGMRNRRTIVEPLVIGTQQRSDI